jgi:hypothetical protein
LNLPEFEKRLVFVIPDAAKRRSGTQGVRFDEAKVAGFRVPSAMEPRPAPE